MTRLTLKSGVEQTKETTKWYDIPYPASAYTFPREALLHRVRFDDEYIHLELTDGRLLSVPLGWIPSLHNAAQKNGKNMKSAETAACSFGTRIGALSMTNCDWQIIWARVTIISKEGDCCQPSRPS